MSIKVDSGSEFYDQQIKVAKESHEMVGWSSKWSQEARFDSICRLICFATDNPHIDLGDFGCGDAALLPWADKVLGARLGKYVGVEIYPPLAEMAKERLRGSSDCIKSELVDEVDFWVASGTFYRKGKTPEDQWEIWVQDVVEKMLKLARVGVCMNFLFKSKCDKFDDDLYYTSMGVWRTKFSEYCTTFVVHPKLYEFTMSIVRR